MTRKQELKEKKAELKIRLNDTLKGWRVEAFTPMGILAYEPIHKTKEEAEKHKAELEKKNQGISFGIVEETLRKERNKELFEA